MATRAKPKQGEIAANDRITICLYQGDVALLKAIPGYAQIMREKAREIIREASISVETKNSHCSAESNGAVDVL